MESKQNAYLYGITTLQIGKVDCDGVGTPAQKAHLVPIGGVGVILSYLSSEFEVNIDDAVRHMRVLENVMDRTTVLPIRFGTLTGSMAELKKVILRNELAIKKELARLKNKYEVGIKGYWRQEKVIAELRQQKGFASLLEEAKQSREAGMTLGQRVEAIVNEWRANFAAKYHQELSGIATESLLGEAGSVEMIYNGSFLVKPEQDQQLKER
ncbi:MAG: GvpL/GvpF family gas vesicle protein, partial [Bacillota bacterium]